MKIFLLYVTFFLFNIYAIFIYIYIELIYIIKDKYGKRIIDYQHIQNIKIYDDDYD